MNIFRMEMARALGSRGFLAGVAGFVLCALLGVWRPVLAALSEGDLRESGFFQECLAESLMSRYLLLALPVLAALPYASSFVADARSRFLRSYLPRCGRSVFLWCRTGATALSGALVMAAGSAACAGLLALVLLPHEARPDPLMRADLEAAQFAAFGDSLRQILLLSLSGSLWALVGALAAAAAMNRHLALAAPFIFFYLLVILSSRYFPGAEALNPQLWAKPSGIWAEAPLAAGGLVAELAAAASLCLAALMERRLQDV